MPVRLIYANIRDEIFILWLATITAIYTHKRTYIYSYEWYDEKLQLAGKHETYFMLHKHVLQALKIYTFCVGNIRTTMKSNV